MASRAYNWILKFRVHGNEVATVVGPYPVLVELSILPVPEVDLLAVGFDPLQGSNRSGIRFSHSCGHGIVDRNASPGDEQHSKDVGDE